MKVKDSLWRAALMLPVAMLPAAVQAASEVKLYGLTDAFVGVNKINGQTATVVDSGGMTTSYWGVGGSEDLGDGLKAVFAAEAFMRVDTGQAGRYDGDPFFARNAYIGFDGSLGRATIGRNTAPYFLNTIIYNPFGDSFTFSPMVVNTFIGAGNGIVQGDTGMNNSLRYTSPKFGGFSVDVLGSLGQERTVAPTRTGRAFDAQLNYGGGPLAMGLVVRKLYMDPVATGVATNQTAVQLGASYDASIVKLFLQYQQQKMVADGAVDQKAKTWQIGASVPIGLGNLLASYVNTRYDDMPTAGERRDTAAVGYDYFLSKRTDIYAMYTWDRTRATDVFAGYKSQKVGLGVRHRF